MDIKELEQKLASKQAAARYHRDQENHHREQAERHIGSAATLNELINELKASTAVKGAVEVAGKVVKGEKTGK